MSNPLVPVVDPTAVCDPASEPDLAIDYAECLFEDGWTFEQVGEWAKVLTILCPHSLRLNLTARTN